MARSRTSFKPGNRANPGGRPKGPIADIAKEARKYGPDAIRTLFECLRDPRHKVAAAQALLDRGYGRPQTVITGDENKPVAIDFSWAPAQTIEATPEKNTIVSTAGNTALSIVWEAAKDDDEQ